jgi:hypothetical protein
MATPRTRPATWADLADRPDRDQLEIIGCEIVHRAVPSVGHAGAEAKYGAVLDPFNRRPGGPRGPATGETIRAEPFEAIEIRVSELLGDDDDGSP